MITPLKHNGTFLLNCPYGDIEAITENVPHRILKEIAEKELKFYVIDA